MDPSNLLFRRYSFVNCGRSLIEDGIVPMKLFCWIFKTCSFLRFPIHSIVPVKPLKSNPNVIKPWRFPMLRETIPVRLFPPNNKIVRLMDRPPIEFGTSLNNRLSASESTFKFLQLLSASKNSQPWLSLASSLFVSRFKVDKPESRPKELGIWPVKLFEDRSITRSNDALHKEAGIWPSNMLSAKKSYTRLGSVLPMSDSNVPPSKVVGMLNFRREDRFLKNPYGKPPDRLFSLRDNHPKFDSCPSSWGMFPSILLFARSIIFKFVRLPRVEGDVPGEKIRREGQYRKIF